MSRRFMIGIAGLAGALSILLATGCTTTPATPTPESNASPERDLANERRKNGILRAISGKYELGSCALDSAKRTNRAHISMTKPTLKGRSPELLIRFYHTRPEGSNNDISIPLGKGTRKFLGADGNEIWETQLTGNSVRHQYTFDRKGSDSWPDLHYEYTTNLTRDTTGNVMIVHSRAGKTHSCALRSLANQRGEVSTSEIRRMKDARLEALARAAGSNWGADVDFDQASLHINRLHFNTKGALNQEHIKETLRLHVIGTNVTSIQLKPADLKDAAKTARSSMATILGLHEDEASDDRIAIDEFVKTIEEFLRVDGGKFKIYLVDWDESDADGRGLFIIDSVNGQVFYLGAGYYS